MELGSKKRSGDLAEWRQFLRLLGLALTTQPRRVPAMARNYLMFSLSHVLLELCPILRRGLVLGKNVRIQRLRSLERFGADSSIEIGAHTILYEHARLEAVGQGKIRIGQYGILGDCRISARELVHIGHRVLTSWNVFIQDNNPHPVEAELRGAQVKNMCRRFYPRTQVERTQQEDEALLLDWSPPTSPVIIGDDVWLGANSTVLKGARIGAGCIVACGSVVTAGDYPPCSVLAGNPACVVRSLRPYEVEP
jgi:acetyltransferase-like isoleucine patch superfamily enzyme